MLYEKHFSIGNWWWVEMILFTLGFGIVGFLFNEDLAELVGGISGDRVLHVTLVSGGLIWLALREMRMRFYAKEIVVEQILRFVGDYSDAKIMARVDGELMCVEAETTYRPPVGSEKLANRELPMHATLHYAREAIDEAGNPALVACRLIFAPKKTWRLN